MAIKKMAQNASPVVTNRLRRNKIDFVRQENNTEKNWK